MFVVCVAEVLLISLIANISVTNSSKQDIVMTKLNTKSISADIIQELPSSSLTDCAISCCSRNDCQYVGMRNETSCILLSTATSVTEILFLATYEVSSRFSVSTQNINLYIKLMILKMKLLGF